MHTIKILSFIFLALFQASCGFKPVYKIENSNNTPSLSSIEITPVATIEGTYFYNHIKSILPPEKDTKYVLNTKLAFTRSYNIIQPNSDILRETQNITVTYQLINKQSLKVLTEGSFVKMSSYSVNFSLYSNTELRQEAIAILAENAAEEIRNRLMIFVANTNHQN